MLLQVYADNKAYVEKHNAEHAAGKHTFTVELNKFADLTTEEWSATYKGLKRGSTRPHGTHKIIGTVSSSDRSTSLFHFPVIDFQN